MIQLSTSVYADTEMKKTFPAVQLSLIDLTILLMCAIPAFYMLGTPAIYIWDEAVYVNASLDMAHGASWLVPVHGSYNTKPPLVLWLQALSLMVIPSAEWAVRLPSAMAVAGILFVMLAGLKRWGFDVWTRLLVMVCFVGHEGFIRHHISRTGDLDAVMTFFMVIYVFVVLDAIHQKRFTSKHSLWFFVAMVGAFYSKSIGGWLMMGPLLMVWLLSPVRSVLFTLRFWMAALLSGLICFMYYLIRELMQPGFLDLVWHSEYMRMFKNVMPWHEHSASYYFTNFITLRTFTPWVYFLVIAIMYCLFLLKENKARHHLFQWIILGLGYMLVITIPAVKLEWYDAPAFPFFAMITGTVAGLLLANIQGRWKLVVLLPVILILGRKMNFIQKDINPRHPFEYEGAILRNAQITPGTKVFMKVETPEHQLQLDFYRKIKLAEEGINVSVVDTTSQIAPGDKIIISQVAGLTLMQEQFVIDTFKVWPGLGYEINVIRKKEEVKTN